ncbi:hypothetical protein COEREDRAFT_94060 [Coemansia reversa NRRL 1564]|uniref:Uncharacterized protein n=1 Tax=Coemansia reversa (strain ATCC 12441 / NRRL 1564) TaxID=763665 RepID=A0A2G5B5C7_COERN|nr:hypothetical protein COEREDRAFT_94060 [Coemansia reversa NRRL 1564]|eukprot:PIA14204.1 hypothetical protein COEREDRAFT_94060 [Coemansia reversa NRRL 1564]
MHIRSGCKQVPRHHKPHSVRHGCGLFVHTRPLRHCSGQQVDVVDCKPAQLLHRKRSAIQCSAKSSVHKPRRRTHLCLHRCRHLQGKWHITQVSPHCA